MANMLKLDREMIPWEDVVASPLPLLEAYLKKVEFVCDDVAADIARGGIDSIQRDRMERAILYNRRMAADLSILIARRQCARDVNAVFVEVARRKLDQDVYGDIRDEAIDIAQGAA